MKREFDAIEQPLEMKSALEVDESTRLQKKNKHWSTLHLIACAGTYDELFGIDSEDVTSELVEEPDFNGCTPLIWASSEGNLEIVEWLIDHGANVNAQNFYGETPLFVAAARGFTEVCSLLLAHGADPNIPNVEGSFPAHMAVSGDHKETLSVLFENGAHANVKDDDGDSLLHYAVREGLTSMVDYLIKLNHCDIKTLNEDNETPLELAKTLNDNSMINILQCY